MSTSVQHNQSSSSVTSELYFLIARFLSSGPCRRAAEELRRELEEYKLLPKRIDWEGTEHERSYDSLVELNRHITSDHLLRISQRLGPLLDKEVKPSVCGVQSLLGAGSQSLLRTKESIEHPRWRPATHVVLHHQRPLHPPRNLVCPSVGHVLKAREMCGQARNDHTCPNHMYSKVAMHARKLGHLSAVYCIAYDRTGLFIFTGADDALIKIWRASSGRLLATLRGHNSEITDIAVNYENTLLASGSCDKMIRVWCLRTKAPVAVLHGHTGMITSLQFCPQARGETRILSSTGGDGCVCFWFWDVTTNTFDPKPSKYIERSRAGAQMLCSSFSPGGVFLATGSADHVIRVYFLHGTTSEKICELEAHSDRVDSICYSNSGERFVSGSRDGTARIWRYFRQEWKAIVLHMSTKLINSCSPEATDTKSKLNVTMVAWNLDDTMVITAVTDYSLKVWDSHTGKLLHILQSHEDEIFVLENNPIEPRILLSAGHDGNVIIWDICSGTKIKTFFNMIEGQGHGAVFDCKFCLDGLSFAATDSHGHLLLFGFGSDDKHKNIPQEVFFHTDYRPLIRDANDYVLDEQTQQPPHLMPPPFLVDIDGNPYPPSFQKLVPGRENFKSEHLVPHMQVNEEGSQEVVGDIETEDIRPEPLPPGPRPSIDNMIQQLQRQQDQRIAAQGLNPLDSPPPPGASPRLSRSNSQLGNAHRVGMRRSGETEGVRQSLGNISQRATQSDIAAWSRRIVVKELDPSLLSRHEDIRRAHTEEETRKFLAERKKKPIPHDHDSSDSGPHMKTRRKHRPNNRYPQVVPENEETARNRLVTRALYDTEEEEEENADGTNSELWNSDDDGESSEYSDWVGDAGTNLQPPTRQSKRRIKRKKLTSSEDDDDDNEEDKDEDNSDTQSSVRSSARRQQPQRKKSVPKKRVEKKKQPSKNKQRGMKIVKKMGSIQELPDEFRPPEWLTAVLPRKAPYVPQMGDEVMYFKQGHQLYLQAVKRHNVYEVNINKNQPWHKNSNLREQEYLKIVGIKYEIKPPRLCCLKLAYIDTETGKPSNSCFTFKYHDMPDVIDFIVLKQYYDVAMQRNWKAGDRFRSMIDDHWWTGTIESQSPFHEEYPDSMFQCFMCHWDNGERERLSPWDMEPIINIDLPQENGVGVQVEPEELKSLMYTPQAGEWSEMGRDVDCDRIVKGMETIMQHSIAEQFLTPVDLNDFPIYAIIIAYPIDLSTIKSRLENRFYRRTNALQFDVRYIEHNAIAFNEPGAPIVKSARMLTDALLRFISETDCEDAMSVLNQLCHDQELNLNNSVSDSDTDDATSSRKRKPSDDGEQVSKRQRTSENRSPDSWKSDCNDLLANLFQCEDSEPFRKPVNPEELPDYYTIITTPMDLMTVKEQFESGTYSNPLEFCRDVKLIFSNSKSFNTNKRSRVYAMTLRLSALFEEKVKDIINKWRSAVKRNRTSNRLADSDIVSTYRTKSQRSAATVATSNIRASSQDGPSTSGASRFNRSFLSTSTTQGDDEEDVDVDDNDEDYKPSSGRVTYKSRSSRPEQRLAVKKVEESNHYDSDTEADDSSSHHNGVDNDSDSDNKKTVKSKRKQSQRKSRTRPIRKSSKGKQPVENGNSNRLYKTRTLTGSIKTKRFKPSGSFSEDDENEHSDASTRSSKSGSSSGNSSSSSAGSSSSSSSSSSSGTESDSDSSKSSVVQKVAKNVKRSKVKPRLKATDNSPKETARRKTTRKARGGKTKTPDKQSKSDLNIRTRSQGKRTIRYKEDSDYEYSSKVNNGRNDESETETDSDQDAAPVESLSSRGRVRRLTARARANLLGE